MSVAHTSRWATAARGNFGLDNQHWWLDVRGSLQRLAPGFIAASALFLWLPSWIGQYGLYGGEPGRLTVSRYLEIIFGYLGWNMIGNLLGQFAWFEIDFPTPVYVVFICLLVLSLLISVHHLLRAATRGNWDINL